MAQEIEYDRELNNSTKTDWGHSLSSAFMGFGTTYAAYASRTRAQQVGIGHAVKAQSYAFGGLQALYESEMAAKAMEENRAILLQSGEKLYAKQVTQAAAAGVTLDSQSFQIVQQETMSEFAREAGRMANQAKIYRLQGQAKAAQMNAAAAMENAQAKISQLSGKNNFWAEVIQGAGKLTQMWGNNGLAWGYNGDQDLAGWEAKPGM